MEEAVEILKNFTGHNYIVLTDRGNTAIMASLEAVKELGKRKILTVDQGGWLTYLKYPIKLGLQLEQIKTKTGVIQPDELQVDEDSALLYENPAGYFAEQPIKEIYQKCNGKCLVIMDVTGCIGDKELCNGEYADILSGSFGEWKSVDLGYGGFISCKNEKAFRAIKKHLKGKFNEEKTRELTVKLNEAPKRLEKLYAKCEKVKNELKAYDIIYPDKKGIVVVVRYSDENQKAELIKYCENNKYEFTLCPRYIKVMENAISIEIKRLKT